MEGGFQCAGCGERNFTTVDESAGRRQSYVEDCQVCCKPNLLSVEYEPSSAGILHCGQSGVKVKLPIVNFRLPIGGPYELHALSYDSALGNRQLAIRPLKWIRAIVSCCFEFSRVQSRKGTTMATSYTGGARMVAHNMVTTQFELDGFRVTRTLGVVRGIVVRSRSIFGTIGAGLQTLIGGNITLLTNLCEKTRAEAFDLMLQHAAELGGNAVVGARYDATEVMQGVTEVLAYGTAVFVEHA